jgi:hypothetical protein
LVIFIIQLSNAQPRDLKFDRLTIENGLSSGFASCIMQDMKEFIWIGTVIFWLSNKKFYMQDIHNSIGDVILGVAFLSLFIIQKSFNRFSASLHLKMNELVASNKSANNSVINAEEKNRTRDR